MQHLAVVWSLSVVACGCRCCDFALFGMFTALGGQLAFKIDNIMIAPLIGVEENGIYSIMVFMTVY